MFQCFNIRKSGYAAQIVRNKNKENWEKSVCGDVCFDQNRSEEHCPRLWAGGCHWCVNL